MPERPNGTRGAGGWAALVAAFALAGCVETGDFGRVKRSAWNDIVASTGTLAASARREPVSGFPLTDDETDLRGRAWRFLVPAHDGAYLQRLLAELVATRILPADMAADDPASYYAALTGEDAASPASRYRRLGEDAAADARLVGPFADMAARVLAADRVRLATLDYAAIVSPADIADATARVAENRCLVAWVRSGLAARRRAYGFALEHLAIATPQADAVPAERSLARLAPAQAALERLPVPPLAAAACLGPPVVPPPAVVVAPPPPALVSKG